MTDLANGTDTPKKVMVIDDHILFREGLISLFRSTPDFQIVGEAGSVYEGIENARSLRPDIILMDFSLPDGTGLDATKAILKETPDCKIVFLTVHETDDKLFAAIRAGAKGYLPKNVAGQNLLASLRALERDELAFSRKMTSRIIEEFSQTDLKSAVSEEILVKLTTRELEVLGELSTGASNLEIAQRLFLSENTVKHHVQSILDKLGVENRRQAGQLARQAGLKSESPGA
jgi:two-component system nitrate/nitrite response regulator NarL